MPIDKYAEEPDEKDSASRSRRAPTDFDCPSCNANNPLHEPLRDGGELLCHYCGNQYLVRLSDGGRLRLKEL